MLDEIRGIARGHPKVLIRANSAEGLHGGGTGAVARDGDVGARNDSV